MSKKTLMDSIIESGSDDFKGFVWFTGWIFKIILAFIIANAVVETAKEIGDSFGRPEAQTLSKAKLSTTK